MSAILNCKASNRPEYQSIDVEPVLPIRDGCTTRWLAIAASGTLVLAGAMGLVVGYFYSGPRSTSLWLSNALTRPLGSPAYLTKGTSTSPYNMAFNRMTNGAQMLQSYDQVPPMRDSNLQLVTKMSSDVAVMRPSAYDGVGLCIGAMAGLTALLLAVRIRNNKHLYAKDNECEAWALCATTSEKEVETASTLISTTGVMSWEALRDRVLATATGSKLKKENELREVGEGPPHTDCTLRLFGRPESEIRVTLYRDSAAWCPYCQKVWMLFEEKKIPYKIAKINMRSYGDKPDWFLKKIPSGLLPVVEIDGQIITESLDIMQILDKMYVDHGPQMVPIEGPERELAVQHLKLERKLFSDWCGLVFRPSGLFGMGDSSKKSFVKTLTTVDQELGSRPGPWFLGGDDPSLVDLQYISHVERMLASALYWKGLRIRNSGEFPNIDRWLDAFELRPSYQATKSDYYTHVRDIPPQYGDGYFDVGPEVTMARETIEGGCWRLPLSVDEDSLEPLTAPFNAGEEAARLEAAFKLVNNHLAVAEFAARGCGEPGKKRFQAPLADPYATPNEKYVPEVDALLRKLVQTLVDDNAIDTFRHGPPVLVEGALSRDATDLITCLKYLRDRVGVPRDMGFHAALQLRSHLNEIIFALGGNA